MTIDRIEVWGDENPPPTVVKVKLRKGVGQGVELVAVDAKGRVLSAGVILQIFPIGIRRAEGIAPRIGLPLDDKGKVRLLGE